MIKLRIRYCWLPSGLIGALKTVLIIKRMAKTFIVDFDVDCISRWAELKEKKIGWTNNDCNIRQVNNLNVVIFRGNIENRFI